MKRKPKLAPRNPLVAAGKFRKAGAHDTTEKAKRRAEKRELQREVGRAARHLAFNQIKDGFESLTSHHPEIPNACCPGQQPFGVSVPQ